jgi:hypothetical protein
MIKNQWAGWKPMTSISGKGDPIVRRISVADVAEALGQGLRDFQAAPLYGLMFGAFYAAGGILIVLSVTALGMVYPLIRLRPVLLLAVCRDRTAGGAGDAKPGSCADIWHDEPQETLMASSRCSSSSYGCARRLLVAVFGLNATFRACSTITQILTTNEASFLVVGTWSALRRR